MKLDFYWHNYKYLPYEKRLARRELVTLARNKPVGKPGRFSLEASKAWGALAYRTTYFREVVAASGSRIIPHQALMENSANGKFGSNGSDSNVHSYLHRQSTRYSAHGLHEYRGKFNPQIVRAIGNIIGLKPGDCVLDPFCGCGTTLLEAAHIGWNAMGVDINPLGIEITRAKIAAMHVPSTRLSSESETLKQRLNKRLSQLTLSQAFTASQMRKLGGASWQDHLPGFCYLQTWFTESVLVQLSLILQEISKIRSEDVRLILSVILSDIIRQVSLQDPADLRIRRRKSAPENFPVIPMYVDAVTNKILTIVKAKPFVKVGRTVQDVLLGDARSCARSVQAHAGAKKIPQFDAAITSPPYATALPYIDTQRLSLVLLGLIDATNIRVTERSLIGNREITTRERLEIEEAMRTNYDHLPTECLGLCQKLWNSLDKDQDGFRRQNVPALLYKYLTDMALTFRQIAQLLQRDAPFALIVGRNNTRLGGRNYVIDTPHLLSLVARANGFALEETLELETYQRFDVHRANSICSENLLILKRI